jgi:hypothetical protein
MHDRLIVSIVATMSGVALLWLWKYLHGDSTFYCALAAFLVSFYWGLRWAILTGRLIVGKSGELTIGWSSHTNQTEEDAAKRQLEDTTVDELDDADKPDDEPSDEDPIDETPHGNSPSVEDLLKKPEHN